MPLKLIVKSVPDAFGVAHLSPTASLPDWVSGDGFWAIINSDHRLALICDQPRIPADVTTQRDWPGTQNTRRDLKSRRSDIAPYGRTRYIAPQPQLSKEFAHV